MTPTGKVRKIGYDINFNRYFYTYQPPCPLEAIEADIAKVEKEMLTMLRWHREAHRR